MKLFLLFAVVMLGSCRTYGALELSEEVSSALSAEGNFLVLSPPGDDPDTGIIWYPGALVEAEAYLPAAWETAVRAGVKVVVVKMPLRMAVLAPGRGASVPDAFPDISRWYIAGHSLGGAMAASAAERRPELFSGVILLGAYPPRRSTLEMPVLSIYAEHDGLATVEKIMDSREQLPSDAVMFMIPGGNHAWFGNYGEQRGDGTAEITPQQQWMAAAEQIAEFIDHMR